MLSNSKIKINPNRILNFIISHSYGLMWGSIYILMLLDSLRFGFLFAFTTTSTSVIAMFTVHRFVRDIFIPKLLVAHRKFVYYFLSFIIISLVVYFLGKLEVAVYTKLIEEGHIDLPERVLKNSSVFPFFKILFLSLCSLIVTTVSHLVDNIKEKAESNTRLMNEKLDMELRYLKAQINPHFLFNALNNIYALVYTEDKKAPESILKLSEMLRYVTDDCQAEYISLQKEINYIDNYIDLQLMRLENMPNVTFDKQIENIGTLFPPMIFQPIVENSFKYARLESDPKGFIRISIEQTANSLIFTTENTIARKSNNNAIIRDGVGLINVQKRLELAFGDRYSFETKSDDHIFITQIKVDTK